MRRSQQLEQHIVAVRDFRDALVSLMEVMERRSESVTGHFYRWVPKPQQEGRGETLRSTVSELAGPASNAANEAGILVTLQEPLAVGGRSHTVNAIMSWSTILDPPNLLTAQAVLDYCSQVIGSLQAEKKSAEAQERSLAGRVARFVRFPFDVREATGLPDRKAVNAAAVGFGVFIQGVVVTVVGGVIVAAIILLFGWAGQ